MRVQLAALLPLLWASYTSAAWKVPEKIRGVNLGSWLLIEPWMLPEEWVALGGEIDCDCNVCIGSEYNFAKAYPDTVDERMATHWETWFTQTHIDTLKKAGINSVRIPLGYWIVEDLVDRETEFYARGGLKHLKRGLRQLKAAGIGALLDHHALPGVANPNQMFAGRCVNQADVKFYTPYNYGRALIWTAVMTALSHLDRDFENVWGIEAMNEPIMDANLTPGYGQFQKNFVQTIRAVELALGIRVDGLQSKQVNVKATLAASLEGSSEEFNAEVSAAVSAAVPILDKLGFSTDASAASLMRARRDPLHSTFMDASWQYNGGANPADAAIGPQLYDSHLYYSYGGVADHTEEAYLTHVCNLDRLEIAASTGNTPLFFGEWSLATGFPATDEFLFKWADAQKLKYSEGAGWFFWNFKLGSDIWNNNRQWSFLDIVEKGFFKWNPTEYNNPDICVPYINSPEPEPETPAPEPETPAPEPETPAPEPETPAPEPEVPEPETSEPETESETSS